MSNDALMGYFDGFRGGRIVCFFRDPRLPFYRRGEYTFIRCPHQRPCQTRPRPHQVIAPLVRVDQVFTLPGAGLSRGPGWGGCPRNRLASQSVDRATWYSAGYCLVLGGEVAQE